MNAYINYPDVLDLVPHLHLLQIPLQASGGDPYDLLMTLLVLDHHLADVGSFCGLLLFDGTDAYASGLVGGVGPAGREESHLLCLGQRYGGLCRAGADTRRSTDDANLLSS